MRAVRLVALLTAATLVLPSSAQAQSNRVLDIVEAVFDRFLVSAAKEQAETGDIRTQLEDAEAKITKYERCARDFETGGGIVAGRLGQIAARAAIKAKCGPDAESLRKERQKILDGPEKAAAQAGGFQLPEYRSLRDRLRGYLAGDRTGFTPTTLELLKRRESDLAKAMAGPSGVYVAGGDKIAGAIERAANKIAGSAGMAMAGANWSGDFAWSWISQLFSMQFSSGATVFERPYQPGEWTRWNTRFGDDMTQETERAYIGKQSDGSQWWRINTITRFDRQQADTVILEALFRPEMGNEFVQELVRMRAKLPDNPEPQEMLVPEQWSTWNMMGTFRSRPTPESVEGATVGIETITTPAGTFKARHVRFGQPGGTLSWWVDESTTGGWVKFQAVDGSKQPTYTMELVGKGTGAKSVLGVTIK
ncbi:MAG: hypothetical protein RL625_271 [Gemmatimonadota bacterium]|jgi:hypothetical protein